MKLLKNINHLKTLILSALVFGVVALLASPNAFAATKTWTGATDNDWSTAGNWSPSGAPANGDDLAFDADTLLSSDNDISSLTVHDITFTGSATGVAGIKLSNPTIVSGSITNSSSKSVFIHGGFTLGADVITSGNLSINNISPAGSALNQLALAGHRLSFTNNPTSITGIESPITGSGTVEYTSIASLQLGAVNTYSGSTIFSNVDNAFNTTTPSSSRNPTQMFGTSSITIGSNSSVQLYFSADGSFNNVINLLETSVSGNLFNGQISVDSSVPSSNFAISLPNINLLGNGGIALGTGIATVDLAGIQTNGHCIYLQTIYQNRYLNAPTVCNGSSESNSSTVPVVPGTPNSGKSQNSLIGIVSIGVAGIVLTVFGVKRGIVFAKSRR